MANWLKWTLAALGFGGIGYWVGHAIGSKAGYETGWTACERAKSFKEARDEYAKIVENLNEQAKMYQLMHNYAGDTDGDEGDIPVVRPVAVPPEMEEEEDPPEMEETVQGVMDFHPEDFKPVPITEDEFNRNINGYEIKILIFFAMDEVLYDPDDKDIVKESHQILGHGWDAGFGGDPNNPVSELYFENETEGRIYKVEYYDAAFCDTVDGSCPPEDE